MKSAKKIKVLKTIDNGREHISLSHPHRIPTWDEIKWVRYAYGDPEKFYVMVLPPKQNYVNLHPYCMHLWEVQSIDEINTWKEMAIHENG